MGVGTRVSPLLDTNDDGELDATEIELGIERILVFALSQKGNVWIYAEGRTVPPVTDQAARIAMLVLVLQGEPDASTPARGIARLPAAFAKKWFHNKQASEGEQRRLRARSEFAAESVDSAQSSQRRHRASDSAAAAEV